MYIKNIKGYSTNTHFPMSLQKHIITTIEFIRFNSPIDNKYIPLNWVMEILLNQNHIRNYVTFIWFQTPVYIVMENERKPRRKLKIFYTKWGIKIMGALGWYTYESAYVS